MNSTHVTRLRRLPGPPTAAAAGRRLSLLHGAELSGDLHTLGYFSAEVCIGSPAKRFDMIIDTGSALAVLPCADCTHCGQHRFSNDSTSRYSEAASTTSQAVPCGQPPPGIAKCEKCDRNRCGYELEYFEGSKVRGRLVRDLVWFGTAAGRRAVRAAFGCQTRESGMIFGQVADGIVGLSPSAGLTLFDYLRRKAGCPDAFSMCLGDAVGAMVLGGTLRRALQGSVAWIPYAAGAQTYQMELVDISFAGRGIGVPAAEYRDTMVDSGTGFTYVPTEAFGRLAERFRARCPWGACSSRAVQDRGGFDLCYRAASEEIERMPPMALHFAGGATFAIGPRQYTYEDSPGVHCLTIRDNKGPGVALGLSVTRHHEVVFDRAHRRLAFLPSDCAAVHAGEQDSALEGGFSLNGCDAAGGEY